LLARGRTHRIARPLLQAVQTVVAQKKLKVAINGFGRIGRNFLRCWEGRENSLLDVVSINDSGGVKQASRRAFQRCLPPWRRPLRRSRQGGPIAPRSLTPPPPAPPGLPPAQV
jgi:hypothetical protein